MTLVPNHQRLLNGNSHMKYLPYLSVLVCAVGLLSSNAQELPTEDQQFPIEVPVDTLPDFGEFSLDTLWLELQDTKDWVDLIHWKSIRDLQSDSLINNTINIDFLFPFRRYASDTLAASELF